jgi:hypothetical protein
MAAVGVDVRSVGAGARVNGGRSLILRAVNGGWRARRTAAVAGEAGNNSGTSWLGNCDSSRCSHDPSFGSENSTWGLCWSMHLVTFVT